MKVCLVSIASYATCKHVETVYVFPQNGLHTTDEIDTYEENKKARYATITALSKSELVKVISYSTCEVWENLKEIYEGNDKVKHSKKLTAKRHYENIRIEDVEGIKSYFQRVESAVNENKNQGGSIIDEDFMEKILMTLFDNYSDKVSAIEKVYNQKMFTKEQMFSTFTLFELKKFGNDESNLK